MGDELLALASPPEDETVEPAVHDAARALAAATADVEPDDLLRASDEADILLAESARITEEG